MKYFWHLLYCIIALLSSCSALQAEKEQVPPIGSFLSQYYNYYYDYPASLDDFIQFIEERLPYSDSCIKKDLLVSQILLENSNEISWINKKENYPVQELIILYKQDTVFHLYDSIAFPCLDRLVDLYMDIYYEYPESLDALRKHYMAIKQFKPVFWPTYVCDSVTILCLEKCQSQNILSWEKDEVGLLIMIRNDTVGYWLNYSFCDNSSNDIFLAPTRFFDIDGTGFYPSEELDQQFKNGIRELRLNCRQFNTETIITWHLLKYNRTEGLSLLCDNDDLDIKTEYFKNMGFYLENFADEYKLNSIVFAAPAVEKAE